ncbi:PilZ domain-containing protein [Lacimicrobium alkaliphilum]|uniref:Cyclic diguanosine monophosphate-binding protein n=1 Tax=Lacimicrobium alkaliphilum TaxID=1526571 RepID=A0ABQ1RE47_9ALTE|nr:PilZ domain-containing protein [Lacimicrobium alkaliphilum]GGD67447.1 cyclic diguanosine monophosphate-binding protein [Lacimicrobium alkaliphilum]
MNTENRRQFTRITFSAPVEARQGSQRWQCRLLDISLKGVLIEAPEDFCADQNQSVLLVASLPGISSSLMMEGEIKHQDDRQVGVKITMLDIDSASRLRRLIELNVGDDTLLKRELEKLASPSNN